MLFKNYKRKHGSTVIVNQLFHFIQLSIDANNLDGALNASEALDMFSLLHLSLADGEKTTFQRLHTDARVLFNFTVRDKYEDDDKHKIFREKNINIMKYCNELLGINNKSEIILSLLHDKALKITNTIDVRTKLETLNDIRYLLNACREINEDTVPSENNKTTILTTNAIHCLLKFIRVNSSPRIKGNTMDNIRKGIAYTSEFSAKNNDLYSCRSTQIILKSLRSHLPETTIINYAIPTISLFSLAYMFYQRFFNPMCVIDTYSPLTTFLVLLHTAAIPLLVNSGRQLPTFIHDTYIRAENAIGGWVNSLIYKEAPLEQAALSR